MTPRFRVVFPPAAGIPPLTVHAEDERMLASEIHRGLRPHLHPVYEVRLRLDPVTFKPLADGWVTRYQDGALLTTFRLSMIHETKDAA